MIVLVVSNCPQTLRGDLSKWLFEVSVGVYVGKVSARVRDRMWDRIISSATEATLIYPVRNEQGFDFRTHNCDWKPKDYDGMILMTRPNATKRD
jgi:CRISPR-associated protein Cas2